MSEIDLARLAFALSAALHWVFVIVTLGLVPIVATLHTVAVATGNPRTEQLTRHLGQVYLINYATGIVSGLVMEFQIGMNWSGLGEVTGNVFGAPLAIETIVAFFAEATFLGLWIFGWRVLPRWLHVALIWLVVATAYLSAFWVLVANGFMHNPVGFELRDGVAVLTDFGAVLANRSTWLALAHIVGAAGWVGGFVVAGIGARMLLRDRADASGRTLVRIGIPIVAVAAPLLVVAGGMQFPFARTSDASVEFAASPGWADVLLGVMALFGVLTTLATWFAMLPLLIRTAVARVRPLLHLMVWMMPVPVLVAVCGWIVRETARQPWAVAGVVTVEDAATTLPVGMLAAFGVATVAVTATLLVVDWSLIARTIARGPEASALGAGPAADVGAPVVAQEVRY
ncbi:cytochrome ubiquinol oxidase subunit I [Agromyces sp. LHK192]|uniref:cytochrome ubiquinol oxidase subunit I n=1 Tax=Agromyces sp. LHK192 TaxID=2498704 RepID=UPI000FD7238B|nr:cytochrome ubiquinol oxidase subunit I [Agromyces sp. LHK192]